MKHEFIPVLFIVVLLSLPSTTMAEIPQTVLQQPNTHAYSLLVEAQDLLTAIENGEGLFVDLRDEKAYNRMHITGFINIPYEEGAILALAGTDQPVYLICATGYRSAMAYNLLLAAGGRQVHAIIFGVADYAKSMGIEQLEGADICKPCLVMKEKETPQ